MPKIYEYFGLVFLFYSNDHTPIHIHVKHGTLENKLVFIYDNGKLIDVAVKTIKGKKGLSEAMLSDALKLAKAKEPDITKMWLDFFGKNKNPVCKKITKKV